MYRDIRVGFLEIELLNPGGMVIRFLNDEEKFKKLKN